jgi:hypothetical protein
MTVYTTKPAINLREELASLRNQGGYSEQQFWFENLVTNGTFAADTNWTKGTGWTIGGGVATHSGGATGSLSSSPAPTLVVGTTYSYSLEISAYTVGYSTLTIGGALSSALGSSGTKTGLLVATSASGIFINGVTTFDGSIDNVSVFETDGTDVIHRMPKGWKPKDVFEDGLLQREGVANDYTVVYDGFDYFVKPAVAPSATTQTCVIGVRA